jgi:hypothetical protein
MTSYLFYVSCVLLALTLTLAYWVLLKRERDRTNRMIRENQMDLAKWARIQKWGKNASYGNDDSRA